MSFLDGISNFFATPEERLALQQKQIELQNAKIAQAGLLGANNARAGLLGGTYIDPQTMQASYRAPEMGGSQALFNNAPLPAPGTGGQAPNLVEPLMGSQVPQNQQRVQQLRNQADPAYYFSLDRINATPGLTTDERHQAVAGAASPDLGKALAKNFETPDASKSIDVALKGLANSVPGTPMYAAYKAQLDALAIPAQTLAETIRHNKAEEVNQNLTVSTDPNTGMPIVVDKRTLSAAPVAGLQQPPWAQPGPQASAQPPAPNGVPAQLPTQQTAEQPTRIAPLTSASNVPLRPDVQQRLDTIKQSSPTLAPIIQGMLSGAIPAPEGRAGIDPKGQRELAAAMWVDPNFNMQVWRTRNKIADEIGSAKNGTIGFRIAAARALINHTADHVGNMADKDQNNGVALNAVGNFLTSNFGTGEDVAKLSPAEQSQQNIGGEMVKLRTGAEGALEDRKKQAEIVSPNKSLPDTVSAAGEIVKTMEGQLDPIAQQLNAAYGTRYTARDLMGPEEQRKLDALTQLQNSAKAGQPITKDIIKQALGGQKLPEGMVKQVGTYKGKPVYVDAKGVKHVDMGQ